MIEQFSQANVILTRCFLPVIMLIGILGNILNLLVLSRLNLRQHICTRYFLALASNNLFYSCFIVTYRLLSDGYQYDLATTSIISCKIVYYILNVCSAISPHLIVLASIDRYWSSSSDVNRRLLSNKRLSNISIFSLVLFFSIFYFTTPVLINLYREETLSCRLRPDTIFKQSYVIIQVVFFAILAPFLMTLFGMLTIANTQQLMVFSNRIQRRRRTENQLIRMLLLQVGSHMVFTLPVSIISVLLLIPKAFPSTLLATLLVLFRIPLHFSYAITWILYFASAQLYRREFFRLLNVGRNLFQRNRIDVVG